MLLARFGVDPVFLDHVIRIFEHPPRVPKIEPVAFAVEFILGVIPIPSSIIHTV